MVVRRFALSFAFLLALAPLSGAETTRSYGFTGAPGAIESCFALTSEAALPNVGGLASGQCWVDANMLELAATINGDRFQATLYFDNLTDGAGDSQTVTLDYGYWKDGSFHAIESSTAPIRRDGRGTSPTAPTVVPERIGVTKTPTDIGNATFDFAVTGTLEADSYIAIQITTDGPNTLFTAPSFLTSAHESTATVPLPELPALILFTVGALAVAGIVRFRRR